MLNVLILCTNSDEAGAPRLVEVLAIGLKKNHKFTLVFGEDGPVSKRLKDDGFDVYIIKSMRTNINPFKDFIALFDLVKIIKLINPDVIHSHSTKAGMIGRIAALLCSKSWIYTVHGWGWRGLFGASKLIVILIEMLLKYIPKGHYTYVSKDVMSVGANFIGVKESKGSLIYNGVSFISRSEFYNKRKIIVMMPARVCNAKDHESLILAFESLNDPDYELVLCGSGTESNDFMAIAKKIAPLNFGSIRFLGQRSDISDMFINSDIVVLASFYEALPISIIEAMSFSKPVIATNVGGVSELVFNGINGILVSVGSTAEICSALKLYKDEQTRYQHGSAGFKIYMDNFTDKLMLDSFNKLYNDVCQF